MIPLIVPLLLVSVSVLGQTYNASTFRVSDAEAANRVNTEAGTFRCPGSVVRLDREGIPSSKGPEGEIKPCDRMVEVKETI